MTQELGVKGDSRQVNLYGAVRYLTIGHVRDIGGENRVGRWYVGKAVRETEVMIGGPARAIGSQGVGGQGVAKVVRNGSA